MDPSQADRNSNIPVASGYPLPSETKRDKRTPVPKQIDFALTKLPPVPTNGYEAGSARGQATTDTTGVKRADPPGTEMVKGPAKEPHDASPTTASEKEGTKEPLFNPRLLLTALRESTEVYKSQIRSGVERLGLSPAVATFGALAINTGVFVNLFIHPGMTLGILSTFAFFSAVGLRNDHCRAQSLVGGLLQIGHFAMMGDTPALVTTVTGNLRLLFQSMIPESRLDARVASAIVGAGASIGVFALLTHAMPLLRVENMPMVASVFFSIASALTNKHTTMRCICNLSGNAALLPYLLSRAEVSGPVVVAAAGFMVLNIRTIMKQQPASFMRSGTLVSSTTR